jgi:hypothetical protein
MKDIVRRFKINLIITSKEKERDSGLRQYLTR